MKQTLTAPNETYPGFKYPATAISSFLYARNFSTFIISIRGVEEPLRFKPEMEEKFYDWLHANHVREYNPY